MEPYVKTVIETFRSHADISRASPMMAYMKHKFEFLGIRSPERKELSKPFLKQSALPADHMTWKIVRQFWDLPEREYQYFAMELANKYNRKSEISWIDQYEYMILNKSWWDSVDFIAASMIGNYFRLLPERIPTITDRWLQSGNLWLQRSSILFQLKYKERLDTGLLEDLIIPLSSNREFFIAKAIGWILREYSKTNPSWVVEFISTHTLQPLSKKEGLRLLL